jgi:hypothetical protein
LPASLVLLVALIVCACAGGNSGSLGSSPDGQASTRASYKAQIQKWISADLNSLDTSALTDLQDPLKASAGELAGLQGFSAQTHKALDDLRAIKPSEDLAKDHTAFVAAFEALVKATDHLVAAAVAKSASGMAGTETEFSAAYAQIVAAQTRLATDLGLPVPSTDTTSQSG